MSKIKDLKSIIYSKLSLVDEDPNIERLTLEQLEFINHDINIPCYLEACPGSGKTEVVGLKAAYEIADFNQNFSGVAVLSFTNNATNEITARVKKYAGVKGNKHPHFISTIDSWIYNYIFLPFSHSIVGYKGQENDKSPRSVIDDNSNADFLFGFKTKTPYVYKDSKYRILKTHPIKANHFFYDVIKEDFYIKTPFGNKFIKLSELINTSEFKEYRQQYSSWLTDKKIYDGFWITKKKFWKAGFYTFQDIELLSFYILNQKSEIAKKLAKRFPFIIIDECQDLSPSQILLLDVLKDNGCIIHFVGDVNQAIYQFRKVDPEIFLKYIEKNEIEKKLLSENFRSNQNIVDFCCKIILNDYMIKGNQSTAFSNNCIVLEYNDNEIEELPEYFIKHINEITEETISLDKSAIIGRSWSLLRKIFSNNFNENNIYELLALSISLWNKKNKNTDDLNKSIYYLGKSFSIAAYKGKGSKRDYYCPESIKAIEWRMFLSNILKNYTNNLFPFKNESSNDLTWSQWAKNARTFMEIIWELLPIKPDSNIDEAKRKPVSSGKGGEKIVNTHISDSSNKNIRITSIHDVKGETLDAVLLISSKDKKSNGGHFEQWFNPNPKDEIEGEYKRFGYVACSRPKHLLILALPKLKRNQRKMIEKLDVEIKQVKTNSLS